MSNLAYTRPLGVWNPGVVYCLELQDLDRKTVKAPNFDGGGSYAPSTPVYVGGAGMQIKLVALNTVENGGELRCLSGSAIICNSGSNFQAIAGSTVYIAGQLYLVAGSNTDVFGNIRFRPDGGGGTLTSDAGCFVNLNGTVNVGGTATFANSATFTNGFICPAGGAAAGFFSTVVFTGLTEFGGDTRILSPARLSSTLTASGAGRVVKRPATVIASTGANISGYGPGNTDTVLVRALTAEVLLVINNSGAAEGDEFEVINKSSAFFLDVDTGTGLTISLKNKNENNNRRSCRIKLIGGSWEVLSAEVSTGALY